MLKKKTRQWCPKCYLCRRHDSNISVDLWIKKNAVFVCRFLYTSVSYDFAVFRESLCRIHTTACKWGINEVWTSKKQLLWIKTKTNIQNILLHTFMNYLGIAQKWKSPTGKMYLYYMKMSEAISLSWFIQLVVGTCLKIKITS